VALVRATPHIRHDYHVRTAELAPARRRARAAPRRLSSASTTPSFGL
jgi:hypothetical protein